MPDPEDAFEDDPAADAFVEDFERHRDAIYELVCDYMEDVEISESYVAQLLIDAMLMPGPRTRSGKTSDITRCGSGPRLMAKEAR